MSHTCYVTLSIRNSEKDHEVVIELGEFHSVWRNGVSIGRDPRCTVVLSTEQVSPVAARVIALSGHKLLYRLPPGTAWPLPPIDQPMLNDGNRVDGQPFALGPFVLQFGEVYRKR